MGESTVVVFFTLSIIALFIFFYIEKQNQIKTEEIINSHQNSKTIPKNDTEDQIPSSVGPSPNNPISTPIQVDIGPSVGVMESIRPGTSTPQGTATPAPSASVPSNADTTTLDLFTYFDSDGDGEVNSSEFRASIGNAGSELSDEQFQLTYDTFDENGDGRLNFSEFGKVLAPPPSVFEALPDTFAPAPSATSSSLNELCDQFPWNNLCKYRPGWTGIRPTIEEANVEPETDPVTTNTQNDSIDDLCTKFPWNNLCRDRPGWTGIRPVDETNISDTNTQFDAVCDIQPWQSFCSYRSGWTGIKPPEALGDDAMSAGKYNDAIDFFTIAIETSEPSMKYILYGKRASAYINLEDFQSALTDANTIDPNISGENAAAARLIRFERSGVALYGLDRFTEAKGVYQAGIDAGYTSSGLVLGLITATRAEEDARLFTINSQTPSPSTVESSVDTSTPSPSTFAPSPSTFAPSPSTFAPSPRTPVVNTRSTVLDSLCATPVGLKLEKCSEYPGSTWKIETTSPDTDQGGSQISEAQKQLLDQICDTSPLSDLCKNHDPARYQLALEANLSPDAENDSVVTTPADSVDFLANTCNTNPWLDVCKERDPEKWQIAVDAREAEDKAKQLTRLCTDTPWNPLCEELEGYDEAIKGREQLALDMLCTDTPWNTRCEGREGYKEAVDKKALDELCKIDVSDTKCLGYVGHVEAVKTQLDVFCSENLIDPACIEYVGHEKAKLDKFCSENIINTKCLGYDGHEKAVLDKLCSENIIDTKCLGYDGHEKAVKKKALDAFCSENLWDPSCLGYDGHDKAVLDKFCKIDVSDTKCLGYFGHKEAVKKKALDAFCSENLWNPDCGKYQGHQEAVDKKALDEFCSENITWTKCSGYEGHEEALLEVSTQLAASNALRATCRNDPWGQTCIGMPSGDPNSWTFEEVGEWFTLIGYGEWKTGFIQALRKQSQDISLSSITTVGPFEAPYTPMDFFWRNFENFTRDVVTLFPRQEFIDARDNLFAPYVRNIGDIPPGDPNSWTDEQFVEWLNIEGFKTDLTMSIRMVREYTTFETLDRSNLSAMGIGGLTNWGEYIYDPSDILAARDRLFASVESEVETPPVNDATNWTWEEIKEWLISEGFGNMYLLDQVRLSLDNPDVTFQNLNSETLLLYDSRKTEILNAHNRLFASGGAGVETPPVTDAANWTWEEIKEWLISEGFDDFMLLDMVKMSLEDPRVNLQNLNSETLNLWDDIAKREILDARDKLFANTFP
jgi:tetratricopeptide (TPR) repeat protein